jgi:hypothetical protein
MISDPPVVDMSDDDLEATLTDAFLDRGAEEAVATAAAERVAAFRDDHEADLAAEGFLDRFAAADTYGSFDHRFDHAIGELAAANEDCTDSRPYRLAGFDELAADPDIGA